MCIINNFSVVFQVKKNRKICCLFVIVLLLVILLIIVAYYFSHINGLKISKFLIFYEFVQIKEKSVLLFLNELDLSLIFGSIERITCWYLKAEVSNLWVAIPYGVALSLPAPLLIISKLLMTKKWYIFVLASNMWLCFGVQPATSCHN